MLLIQETAPDLTGVLNAMPVHLLSPSPPVWLY